MTDPAGNPAPPGGFQNLGWYSGYQYYNGTFAPQRGVIHPQSPQVGAGQPVSDEVNRQSAAAQGVSPEQFDAYLRGEFDSGGAGTGAGSGAGSGASLGDSLGDIEAPSGDLGTPFQFDYAAAEQAALEKLSPYYQKKLEEAQFDVDRAKRLIEEDYERGKRYREEDLTTEQQKLALQDPEEFENLITSLNQRGRLAGRIQTPGESKAPLSGYAQERVGRLEEQQDLRRLAVERALERQEEVAQTQRTRGIEEQDIAFPRYQSALEEEKKEKAVLKMAPLQREQEYNKWLATVGNYMQNP